MATLKKRINISISKELDVTLGRLALRDQVSRAIKVEHLLLLALELEEDQLLDIVATSRDEKGALFVSRSKTQRL